MNSTAPVDMLITNAALHDRSGRWSVAMHFGRFVYVGDDYGGAAMHTINANGKLLLPGLLEAHTHIDKTYTYNSGDDAGPQETEALREAIRRMWLAKRQRTAATVAAAARRAFDRAVASGVSHLRSHIDIGDASDLDVARTLLALRDEYRHLLTIEYTALGSCDTPEQLDLMRAALAAGVDCVGGAPALAANPVRSTAAAVLLAEETGKPLDLHIDENENPHSPCLEHLADLLIARHFPLPVLASHCCSLAYASTDDRARVLAKVKAAGISLITLPACNLVLMGRRHSEPKPRGALPVLEALQLGINVCAGTDNVGDPFQPWGDYDPLRSAAICAQVAQVDDAATAFAMVSSSVATALKQDAYGIAPGNRADCSLLDGNDLRQVVAESPLRTHVFFAGKLVLQQQLQQHWNRAP